MKKIVSFVFVVLAVLTFTGCDARWTGGVDPTPPPVVNNYSLFPQPQPQVQVQPVPVAPAPVTVITLPKVFETPRYHTATGAKPETAVAVATEKVWHPFRLPSRERPGMWKEVFIKVDLPTGVDQNTRNFAIAKHEKVLRDNGDCVEDYIPITRSGPQRR
jgi:hypothetical protein